MAGLVRAAHSVVPSLVLSIACARPRPTAGQVASEPKVEAATPSSAEAPAASIAINEPPPDAASPAPAPAPTLGPVPPLFGGDGGLLPQSEELPSTDSPGMQARLELLFRAIVEDEPEIALPAFFPLPAYQQVKAVADAERDYRRRLLKSYERDIHDYHRRLGANAASARLDALELPTERARWMDPGTEGNRIGYWRVLRSKLRYSTGEKQGELPITSFISWRGEWYVVHLNGFE